MSLTTALLSGTAMPTLSGTKQRHLMDNRPITGTNYCREHTIEIRPANVEKVFAAVNAGKRTINEIEGHTKLSHITISKALAELGDNKRVKRSKLGKQNIFEVLK